MPNESKTQCRWRGARGGEREVDGLRELSRTIPFVTSCMLRKFFWAPARPIPILVNPIPSRWIVGRILLALPFPGSPVGHHTLGGWDPSRKDLARQREPWVRYRSACQLVVPTCASRFRGSWECSHCTPRQGEGKWRVSMLQCGIAGGQTHPRLPYCQAKSSLGTMEVAYEWKRVEARNEEAVCGSLTAAHLSGRAC